MQHIFRSLDSMNANVSIYRRTESYIEGSHRWDCSISVVSEGVQLKIQKYGVTAEDAINDAWSAYERCQHYGLPKELTVPAIEHVPAPQVDDDSWLLHDEVPL